MEEGELGDREGQEGSLEEEELELLPSRKCSRHGKSRAGQPGSGTGPIPPELGVRACPLSRATEARTIEGVPNELGCPAELHSTEELK